jgi:hypothetical protein
MKPNPRSGVLALALLLAAAGSAPAQDTLQLVGARELTIPARLASTTDTVLRIPVLYAPGTPGRSLELRTVRVTEGGRPADREAFRFALEPGESGLPTLAAAIDLRRIPDAGTYTVVVRATHLGPQAPGAQSLEFTFTRPAAELRLPSPLRLERVWGLGWSGLRPGAVVLTEIGGAAAITPSNRVWRSELSGPRDRPLAGRLEVTLPAGIDAWGQGEATLSAGGSLPLGSSSAIVTIRSPQLANRSVDVAVELVSRVSRAWLLVAIMLGIALGYLVRVRLEERRQRTAAEMAVEEQRERLARLLREAVDPEVRSDLDRELGRLATALEAPVRSAESLNTAAAGAAERIEALLEDLQKRRAELRARVAAWRVALGHPEAQPADVATELRRALDGLAGAERELTAGWASTVESFLDAEDQRLPVRMREAIKSWLVQLAPLERMGAWAAGPFVRAGARIEAESAPLANMPASPSREQLRELLDRTALLSAGVRHDLLGSGLRAVEDVAEDVLRGLEGEGEKAIAGEIQRAREALDALRSAPRAEEDLNTVAERVHALRAALVIALRKAVRKAEGDAAPDPPGLTKGDFAAALEDVLARRAAGLHRPPPDRALGRRRSGEVLQERGSAPGAEPATPPPGAEVLPAAWSMVIEADPLTPNEGEPVTLRARVTSAQGAPLPVIVTWEVDGRWVGESNHSGPLEHVFTPARPGSLLVRARALDPASRTGADAELTLEVRPAAGWVAIRRLARRGRYQEVVQTIVSGLLIAAAGYVIFEGAFVGTFSDFLAAVLWGFSVDVGVARVRELAQPLVERTIPAPQPGGT